MERLLGTSGIDFLCGIALLFELLVGQDSKIDSDFAPLVGATA